MRRYMAGLMTAWVLAWAWIVPAASWGADLDQALKDVATYEFGKSREPLTVVSDAVRDSQGNPEARKDLMNKLLGILKGKATLDGKQFACRELSLIGTDAAIPVLAGMLTAKDTADMARYALERIPGAAADKALLDALGKTSGPVQVGIVNSLGARQCAAAVGALAPLAASKDKMVAEAAIAALGKIGDAEAVKALVKAKGANKDVQAAWADAYLLCADKLSAQDKDKAAKMYEELAGASEPDRVRVAAFRGRALVLGEKGVPLVVEALQGDNAKLQGAAMEFVRKLEGKAATDAFAGTLPKLAPPAQVLLISALADRGDAAGLPAVTEAAKSKEADVRVAALAAMGKLGSAASVPVLAQVAAVAEKAEKDAARASLDSLRGKDVDGAMVDCMKKAEPPVRAELARSLGARNAGSAVPALIESAKNADEAVRVESFKALGMVATEKDLPALVDLLVQVTGDKVSGDKARPEAEKAVVSISKSITAEDKRAAAVLAVYPKVKAAPAKCSLLTVLGQVGDPNGLKPVFEAAKKGKAEVQDAAIRSLAGWPNPQAVDALLEVAQRSKDETQRALALRGLLRLLEMPSDRGLPQTMAYYEKAMALAKSVDEKKMVLGGLATVKAAEALKLVEPCLANPDLQKEAALAAEKIKTSLYKPSASNNSGEAGRALDGKLDSRWNTGENQKNGQWFMVDLGAEYEVSKIVLDCTPSGEDYPRGYQVFVSTDANNLGSPVVEGKGTTAVTEIAFPAKVGRYVKIVQTGTAEKNFWTIHELKIESKSVAQPEAKGKKAK